MNNYYLVYEDDGHGREEYLLLSKEVLTDAVFDVEAWARAYLQRRLKWRQENEMRRLQDGVVL